MDTSSVRDQEVPQEGDMKVAPVLADCPVGAPPQSVSAPKVRKGLGDRGAALQRWREAQEVMKLALGGSTSGAGGEPSANEAMPELSKLLPGNVKPQGELGICFTVVKYFIMIGLYTGVICIIYGKISFQPPAGTWPGDKIPQFRLLSGAQFFSLLCISLFLLLCSSLEHGRSSRVRTTPYSRAP